MEWEREGKKARDLNFIFVAFCLFDLYDLFSLWFLLVESVQFESVIELVVKINILIFLEKSYNYFDSR